MEILLVEDDELDALLVSRYIRQAAPEPAAYNITQVVRLEEALVLLSEHADDFDLVLLDLGLPDSIGLESLPRVHEVAPQVAVVVLTGQEDAALGVDAVAHGADDYLCKGTVHAEELCRVIRHSVERRRYQNQLDAARKATQLATTANHAKTRFLAHMSHEIRTPMNAILGFTQLIEELPDLPDLGRKYASSVRRSGNQLMNLINDVLEMSRIEAGGSNLVREVFNLQQLLDSIEEIFTPATIKRGLEFRVLAPPPELPENVWGDPGKIRQILLNLVGNAVKFTSQGEIVVQTELTGEFENSAQIRFNVIDTGPGIAEADRERIFAPFEQASAPGKGKGGAGLGLSLSRQFAETMGGRLTLASRPGAGSTFTLMLSLQAADGSPAPAEESTAQHPWHFPARIPAWRALIVDDNESNLEVLEARLDSAGFETTLAANGEEALQKFGDTRPDVVFMDRHMPGMDGIECSRRIRELDGGGAEVPIIVVSADICEKGSRKALECGASAFLPKPIETKRLFELIAEVLDVSLAEQPSDSNEDEESETGDGALTAELRDNFHQLEPAWRDRFRSAAEACDREQLLALKFEIVEAHPDLATSLERHVERFDYGALAELCREAA